MTKSLSLMTMMILLFSVSFFFSLFTFLLFDLPGVGAAFGIYLNLNLMLQSCFQFSRAENRFKMIGSIYFK
jgi:hypothetical protein